jgi:hypothetical protein
MARRLFRTAKWDADWWVGLTGQQVVDVLREDIRRTFRVHTVIQVVAIAVMMTVAKIV